MHMLCSPCAVQYDFVSHLETIEADFEFVREKLGVSGMFEFPHANEKRLSGGNDEIELSLEQVRYSQILKLARLYKTMDVTREMILRLYEFHKLDFELYGYSFTDFMRFFEN